METKPVITCLKTLLIVYSFVFWVRIFFFFKITLQKSSQPIPYIYIYIYIILKILYHRCGFAVRDEGLDGANISRRNHHVVRIDAK
ncbi:hypothetical protein F2P81_021388 [Scophthalmus maximus]|uniref:Uncharacterized protein n=1 Tax=Scophthalmus maximus TaxID=52904 RepID=A0A6A4S694_SCOMX|nr:hypothetical protein F2P81_021388 [Scophthalmus maximus]